MVKRATRKRSGKPSGKQKTGFRGNIHLVMLCRMILVLLLFILSRILFYLFNLQFFSGIPLREAGMIFLYGLRFDIAAVMMLNAPYILMNAIPFRFRFSRIYQGIANSYYFVANILGLMLNFIDLVYFRFTLKRTTADIFRYLGVGGDFDKLIPQFLHDFWYVLLVWIAFCFLLVWFSLRCRVNPLSGKPRGGLFAYYFIQLILFCIAGGITVIGIRGGLQLRPISLVTAGKYTSSRNIPLLINTPFTIIKTIHDESMPTANWFRNDAEIKKVYDPVHKASAKGFRKLNVMVIIMESFSREHIGILNRELENGHYQGFTPFIDSLIREGLYIDAYANGKTSIQGIPAILSSIPSLMNESFVQSSHAANRYTGMAGLLKEKGYYTAFFHGGTNGTMGFDAYTRTAGFDHYFGRTEYGNEKDYDGKWGICDDEFFRFTAEKMRRMPQPFLVSLFSLSSHHPYFVPGKYKHIFRTGKLPIQQSIMYSDFALGSFFHTVRHMPWFRNTLFIITADHTSEGYYPKYQTNLGQFAIPILLYMPGSELRGRSSVIAQQTDIMPTVLQFLGYDRDYLAFGSDILNPSAPHFSVHYLSGIYGLVKDGCYLEFDGTDVTALYDLSSDPDKAKNLAGKKAQSKKNLELFLKAFIQQYNNRLNENRLIID